MFFMEKKLIQTNFRVLFLKHSVFSPPFQAPGHKRISFSASPFYFWPPCTGESLL